MAGDPIQGLHQADRDAGMRSAAWAEWKLGWPIVLARRMGALSRLRITTRSA